MEATKMKSLIKAIAFTLCILVILICTLYINGKLPISVSDTIDSAKSKIAYTFLTPPPSKTYENSEPSDKFHNRFVEPDIPLSQIMSDKELKADNKVNIFVDLKTRTLHFKYGEETLKKYSISAGTKTNHGDKEKEGDYRTPRGNFYICSKNIYSPPKGYIGSRWMLLSYPNIEAAERGLSSGLIDESTYNKVKSANLNKRTPPQDTILGSAIGIHGGARPNLSKDWTAGCIGMYNQDVEEIFEFVKIGTIVYIE